MGNSEKTVPDMRSHSQMQPLEPSTIVVEVKGGVVQHVLAPDGLPFSAKVLIHDHDNLRADPKARDDEWDLDGCHQKELEACFQALVQADDRALGLLATAMGLELETRGLPDRSFIQGYKQGFIAALQDENLGPGQVWTAQDRDQLFAELDARFAA